MEHISDNILTLLFGNFNFFSKYDFEKYFKARYKLSEKQVTYISYTFFTLSLVFIGFQMVSTKKIILEGILIEVSLILTVLRIFNYLIYAEFKGYCTTIETIGYFVVNELLMILDTSESLKDASNFIISSDYPLFSEIFTNAKILSHFGTPLNFALKTQIKTNLFGSIQSAFLYILEIWEHGKNIALLSKNRILNRIVDQITEETNKIDSWASLSAGILFLSPPVIFCFLLISGRMSIILGCLIIFGIILGSFFIHPEKHLTIFSEKNKLLLSYDKKSLEFLVILSENLLSGNSFDKSLNIALNILEIYPQNTGKRILDQHAHFRLGIKKRKESDKNFLLDHFPERIVQLVLLIKKFSKINIFMAGKKLQIIAEELAKTNELLGKGDAQLKAAKLHENIIQILALISLGFVAGASPFFILVSNMLYYSFKESSVSMTSAFEPIFFVTALVISLLPIRRISIRGFRKSEPIPWRDIIRFSKFLLFLITYVIVKNVFMGMY